MKIKVGRGSRLVVYLPDQFKDKAPFSIKLSGRLVTLALKDREGLRGTYVGNDTTGFPLRVEFTHVKGLASLEKFTASELTGHLRDGALEIQLPDRGTLQAPRGSGKRRSTTAKSLVKNGPRKLPYLVLIETDDPEDNCKQLRVTAMEVVEILTTYSHRLVK